MAEDGEDVDIKVICKKENYDLYVKKLKSAGFTINPDAELTFKEDSFIRDTLIGRLNESYEIIHYSKIVFVESFGHEIILHTMDKEFLLKERLYEIEGMFEGKGLVRVNKSQIVNRAHITEIKPSLNSRLRLKMRNNEIIDVTRSYQVRFKEFIGF